jgi:hypothetical protein
VPAPALPAQIPEDAYCIGFTPAGDAVLLLEQHWHGGDDLDAYLELVIVPGGAGAPPLELEDIDILDAAAAAARWAQTKADLDRRIRAAALTACAEAADEGGAWSVLPGGVAARLQLHWTEEKQLDAASYGALTIVVAGREPVAVGEIAVQPGDGGRHELVRKVYYSLTSPHVIVVIHNEDDRLSEHRAITAEVPGSSK